MVPMFWAKSPPKCPLIGYNCCKTLPCHWLQMEANSEYFIKNRYLLEKLGWLSIRQLISYHSLLFKLKVKNRKSHQDYSTGYKSRKVM